MCKKYKTILSKEVLITIFIELPHSSINMISKKQGTLSQKIADSLSKIGLAGHSGMAIGNQYFDFGPDYGFADGIKGFSEERYQIDFNEDGDKKDVFNQKDLQEMEKLDYYYAPGKPWWGSHIYIVGNHYGKNLITLPIIESHIKKNWKETNIYGKVYKIEFYIERSRSNKMLIWWTNKYNHLGVYSVNPSVGYQCTTAVKSALREGGINIPSSTQTPEGLLVDLKSLKNASYPFEHMNISILSFKEEAKDYN